MTLEIITTFAIAQLPYSLKPLWSPIIDYCSIPFLSKFGRRASWMICCSMLIAGILYSMSILSPNTHLPLLYILTICLGALTATFDISLSKTGTTKRYWRCLCCFGYRIGLLIICGGALYLAHITNSWPEKVDRWYFYAIYNIHFCFFDDFQFDINISWKNLQRLITRPFMHNWIS